MPSIREAWLELSANTPPMAASTCNQTSASRQRVATSNRGSMAPRTVVPAVATTAKQGRPSACRDLKRSAKASRQRPPSAATGSVWSASSASPITLAALLIETCASWLHSSTGSRCLAPNAARAATSAMRLLRVPPLARTPPEPLGKPILWQNQRQRSCSRPVRPGESSSARRLLLSPAQTNSAAMDAVSGGGSR